MLSKEEYLDNLLKGVAEQENEQNNVKTLVEESMPEQASDLVMEEPEPEVVSDLIVEDAPMAELPLEETEIEPSIEPKSDVVLDADLAALLEAVPEMAAEEEAEPEQASDLVMEEPEPEVISDLIVEDAPMAELPLEETENDPSIEPESDVVLDADLAALLEAVPEMAVEEEIEPSVEDSMPELTMEEEAEPEQASDLVMEEPEPEVVSDLIMEDVSMAELPLEEPEIEPSIEPESDVILDADLDADLDAMLESVPEMTAEEESVSNLAIEEEPEPEPADNLDSYSDIGDDIEARLDMAAELPPVPEEFPDDDVMSMLEESDDSDLQEIQELLRKSDSNEAVDSSVEDLLKELPEEDLEAKILGDSEETPTERRRRAKEEKAREKAEKKAEAAARKAAKKAEKEAAKRGKAAAGRGQTQDEDDEQAFDPAVLDSIVSEAGLAGSVRQNEELPTDILGDMTEGGEEEPFNPLAEADEIPESPRQTEEPDDLGVDLDNIFGSEEALMGEESVGLSALGDDQDASDVREKGEKKKGIFSRLIDFLTEEDEEEEGNENIQLSQENQDILNELDKEKGKKKKGKKGKKGKGSAEDEEASGKGAKGKKAAKPKKESKPKKPPKPKKEKPPKETPLIPERKLTFKRMLPVLLVGVSVGVLLFVFVNATVDFTDKKTARDAFYAGDYQTCYQNLFGKELDETESIMFGKSKSILYIRLWTREYQMFAEEGDRVRGLDSLIQTVAAYPELYEYAQQWNAEEEVAAGYATILNLLKSEYGLSESQALEISKIWRDVDYTRAVIAAAGGNFDSKVPNKDATGSGNDQGDIGNSGESQLPDFLPEEEGLGGENFHDNR